VAKLADAKDLKSFSAQAECGFKSRPGHQEKNAQAEPRLSSGHDSPYDAIAGLYHRQWDNWYVPQAAPALERLFFPHLRPGAWVLEVCCGSGHMTRELVSRGYRVTGIDNSATLLEYARREVPQARFLHADARDFRLEEKFEGALSTFDSMNHLLSADDLASAFLSVHAALEPAAPFVFDMNTAEAYRLDWTQWTAEVTEDSVSLVQGRFDPASRCVETEVIWFLRTANGCWERRRSVVPQRCYEEEEVWAALDAASFRSVTCSTAMEAGVTGEIGYGRVFFSAIA
jgi:SAM-dependent methyltransferase